MNYLINYTSGASQWSDTIDLQSMASLISVKAVVSVIDVKQKKALIGNYDSGKMSIGWAEIPEYASFNPDDISVLEE